MSHNTLERYYKEIFSMTYHHKWPNDVEDMIPYERDLYMAFIRQHMEQLKEEQLQEQQRRQAMERSRF
jgi:hypothetical protein